MNMELDVTAVSLHEKYIVVGAGFAIHIFDRTSHKFIMHQNILRDAHARIHGFMWLSNDILAVYGAKHLVVVRIRRDDYKRNGHCMDFLGKVDCDDWIVHTACVCDKTIAVLTAHNQVQMFRLENAKLIEAERLVSDDKSILYSGLLLAVEDALGPCVVVMSGTVYSHILVRHCRFARAHTLTGHKGVVFSIKWCEEKETIVSTSDDRSVRIWSLSSDRGHSPRRSEYWESCSLEGSRVVYGHISRVMSCAVTPHWIVSVGEDSQVCFWNMKGELVRKMMSHQNGCVWSVDADGTHAVTGGADSSVVLHPLTLPAEGCRTEIVDTGGKYGAPKTIMFTVSCNIIIFHSSNVLRYCDASKQQWHKVSSYDNTYKMLALSPCNKQLAVVDVNGNLDVFSESFEDLPQLKKLASAKMNIDNVCSLHWAGTYLLICNKIGEVTVIHKVDAPLDYTSLLIVPPCRERWLTAAEVHTFTDFLKGWKTFIVGDRTGNIHFYSETGRDPVMTIYKAHGTYGPTSIIWKDPSFIMTTGRDGTVKTFLVERDIQSFECLKLLVSIFRSVSAPFHWVEKIILNKQTELIVCGFRERSFVVYDAKSGLTAIEVPCGGGHRAWDVVTYRDQARDKLFLKFIYLKDASVKAMTFELDKFCSKHIAKGTHSKEVNALKYNSKCMLVGGGEDTMLRVGDMLAMKQVSSIKAVALQKLNGYDELCVSGGGRGNVCVNIIRERDFEFGMENVANFRVKGTDAERRNLGPDDDPEMRITSVDIITFNTFYLRYLSDIFIIAGCSDGTLRIFEYHHDAKSFTPGALIPYHKTCVLVVQYNEKRRYVFSATTRGIVCVWSAATLVEYRDGSDCRPLFTFEVGCSGVNCLAVSGPKYSYGDIREDKCVATGGDDNAVTLVLLRLDAKAAEDEPRLSEIARLRFANWHSGAVTGAQFVGAALLTVGVDQRITLSRVLIRSGEITCVLERQLYTNVCDPQGMCVYEIQEPFLRLCSICVYGKGIEKWELCYNEDGFLCIQLNERQQPPR